MAMGDGIEIAAEIIARGKQIERKKDGKALTPDEARTVRAGTFLQRVLAACDEDKGAPRGR